jgi:phosphate transport system substrate-binding protein
MTLVTLVGCQKRPEPLPTITPAYPELGITLDNYPSVDGSTSAQPLLAKAACSVFGVKSTWVHSETDDSRTLWAHDYEEVLNSPESYHAKIALYDLINKLIHYNGTHEAYVNLVNGRADLILVARLPSEDELLLAKKREVPLESRPVALDAFVFLLNPSNPVETLTIEQIRGIYSGRIVNWREVGGPDAAIRPYQRNRNSGSQELMQKLVMKERAMIKAPDLLVEALMSSSFLTINQDVQGIGYSVYYYQEFMAPSDRAKSCAIENVVPTSETIRSRRYPFVTEVYVVVRRDLTPEHPARRLRDWLLSPTGQRMVEQTGYVAVSETANP